MHGLIVDRKESGAPGDSAALSTESEVLEAVLIVIVVGHEDNEHIRPAGRLRQTCGAYLSFHLKLAI